MDGKVDSTHDSKLNLEYENFKIIYCIDLINKKRWEIFPF